MCRAPGLAASIFGTSVEGLARSLPPAAQDDIGRLFLRLAGTDEAPPMAMVPEERAAIAASKAAAARGEFATDTQVRAVRAKYGL